MAAESLDLHTVTPKFQTGIMSKPQRMTTAEPPDAMLKSQIPVIEKGDTTVKKDSFMIPMQVCLNADGRSPEWFKAECLVPGLRRHRKLQK